VAPTPTYPGLGAHDLVPKPNLEFEDALTPADYFVLTRVDGATNLKDLVLISGLPESAAVQILVRLRSAGAMLLPGDVPPPKKPKLPPPPPVPEVEIDESLLAEENDLTVEQRRSILTKHAAMFGATFFDVLEVQRDTPRRQVKLNYFRLSKDFHPDRFYGKKLGSFQPKLTQIFDVLARAFEVLSDDNLRALYEEELDNPIPTPQPAEAPVTARPPADPPPPKRDPAKAARLFEDACEHQLQGEIAQALGEFGLAIALDPQPRYLRRAAECALKAQELRSAEEYAKKLAELEPQNPAAQRLLEKVLAAKKVGE